MLLLSPKSEPFSVCEWQHLFHYCRILKYCTTKEAKRLRWLKRNSMFYYLLSFEFISLHEKMIPVDAVVLRFVI